MVSEARSGQRFDDIEFETEIASRGRSISA